MTRSSVGSRIAVARRRRGLSQVALAGLIGRSESWLSQVERGVRDVDSLTVLRDLARVLRVEIDALTAAPPRLPATASASPGSPLRAAEDAVFTAASAESAAPTPREIDELHVAYQAAE